MPPDTVIFIRHAEKPMPGGASAFTRSGKPDPHSLTAEGWQRAGALVRYFHPLGAGRAPSGLPRPDHIFAARFDPALASDSRRPKQTARALAESLGLKRDLRFPKGDEAGLAQAILSCSGTVLVCWAHEHIAAILDAMGLPKGTAPAWPEDRYDLVWVLTPKADGWTFRQQPQRLMPGDRDDLP